jgi:hypothetical protein
MGIMKEQLIFGGLLMMSVLKISIEAEEYLAGV